VHNHHVVACEATFPYMHTFYPVTSFSQELIFTKKSFLGGGEIPRSAFRKGCHWCQRSTTFFSLFDRLPVFTQI